MNRFPQWIAAPGRQVRIAGYSTILWVLLSPITMLTALRSSLPWLTAASLFANIATCFGWWVAAWANQRASNVEARTDEMATLTHIGALVEQIERVDQIHGDQLAAILEALHFPVKEESDSDALPSSAAPAATPRGVIVAGRRTGAPRTPRPS